MDMKFILGMLPKEKMAGMLKEHIPTLLNGLMDAVRAHAGATHDQRTGVLFFQAAGTTMATVYTIDALDQPGEVVGTIDLVDTFRKLDLLALFDKMNAA